MKLRAQQDWYARVGIHHTGPYQVNVWCEDCLDDPLGCNEDLGLGDEVFDTIADAIRDGQDTCIDVGPWRYEVLDNAGNVVDIDNWVG